MSPRTIRLRRPAVLSVAEGIFVPPCATGLMDEVDRRWARLQQANPAYFDGRLYHVLGVHRNGHGGCTLHVIDCAYRFFAVQDDSFDLGVRPLGLKGLVERDGQLLMGLRSTRVATYHNKWEFAPAGGAESGRDPAEVIQQELREETGLESLREPTSIAILFDPVLRCWELVYRLYANADAPRPRTGEYTQLAWFSPDALPPKDDLSPVAQQIADMLHLPSRTT